MPERARHIPPEQQENKADQIDYAFEAIRRHRRDAKPLNFSPEDVAKLTEMMDTAIEAYKRYKQDNQIKDGQEALRLLEGYRDEFVRLKEDKEVTRDKSGNISEVISFTKGRKIEIGLWPGNRYFLSTGDDSVSNPTFAEGKNFLLFPKDEVLGNKIVKTIKLMQKEGRTASAVFVQIKRMLEETSK